jgi:hypothetical protein
LEEEGRTAEGLDNLGEKMFTYPGVDGYIVTTKLSAFSLNTIVRVEGDMGVCMWVVTAILSF